MGVPVHHVLRPVLRQQMGSRRLVHVCPLGLRCFVHVAVSPELARHCKSLGQWASQEAAAPGLGADFPAKTLVVNVVQAQGVAVAQ